MVKVVIICPWWRRFDVVNLHLKSMAGFIKKSPSWVEIKYLSVVSQEDPEYKELVDLGHSYGIMVSKYRNMPLGQKLNAGIWLALKEFSPDYIMNMGSDDLCLPLIWNDYKPFIEKDSPVFGIDSCHIIDYYSKKAYYLDLYNDIYPVGVLRMISTKAILRLKEDYNLNLYPSFVEKGLDTASLNRLMRIGIKSELIHMEGRIITAGLKHNVSINHFFFLSNLEKAKPVDFETIKHILP